MTDRLSAICSLVSPAPIIADVGCDHGSVASYCLGNRLAEKVIASDVSEACLGKAKRLIGERSDVEYVLCDGIRYECDEAIIAGMGGMLISRILREAHALPQTLILSPHTDFYECRRTVIELGYGIDRDISVEERKKYYAVIRAVKGGGRRALDDLELMFGAELNTPSQALAAHLLKLYNTYMLAPEKNSAKLSAVQAALIRQGVDILRDGA